MTDFDWRQYITISPDFPPEQRKILEQALDDIGRFHDREGQELILAAFARSGSRPVTISPGESSESNLAENGQWSITLNMQEQAATRVPAAKGPVYPGIFFTLVHELYHCADSQADVNAQAIQTFAHLLDMPADDPRLQQAIELLRVNSYYPGQVGRVLAIHLTEPTAAAEFLREQGFPDIADRLAAVVPATAIDALRGDGVISNEQSNLQVLQIGPIMRYEEDAVDYTDALLKKNYGPAYTERGSYLNILPAAYDRNDKTLPSAPEFTGILYETHGFSADPYQVDGLDDISAPPQVRATDGREAPIPTRDGYQR